MKIKVKSLEGFLLNTQNITSFRHPMLQVNKLIVEQIKTLIFFTFSPFHMDMQFLRFLSSVGTNSKLSLICIKYYRDKRKKQGMKELKIGVKMLDR